MCIYKNRNLFLRSVLMCLQYSIRNIIKVLSVSFHPQWHSHFYILRNFVFFFFSCFIVIVIYIGCHCHRKKTLQIGGYRQNKIVQSGDYRRRNLPFSIYCRCLAVSGPYSGQAYLDPLTKQRLTPIISRYVVGLVGLVVSGPYSDSFPKKSCLDLANSDCPFKAQEKSFFHYSLYTVRKTICEN